VFKLTCGLAAAATSFYGLSVPGRCFVFLVLLGSAAFSCCTLGCTEEPRADSNVPLDEAWRELLDWNSLPVLGTLKHRTFSSYDRSEEKKYPFVPAGDKDFNNFLAVCGSRPKLLFEEVSGDGPCEPGLEGHLIAADDGPGFVSRMLFSLVTIDQNIFGPSLGDERIRIYADDLETPAYDGALSDWKAGNVPPFSEPLAGWTSGAIVSYLPIRYESKLRIFLDNLVPKASYYYHVDIQSGEDAIAGSKGSRTPNAAPLIERLIERVRKGDGAESFTDVDAIVQPGQTLELLNQQGPGTLRALSLRIPGATVTSLQELQLAIRWDDQEALAIDLPLSSVFGAQQTLSSFETLPMTVHASASQTELSLYLPMPFASRAHIELTSRSILPRPLHVRVQGVSSLPQKDWGYLHMSGQRRTEPFAQTDRYPVADLRGRGKYVGTMMFMKGRSDPGWELKDPLNFLEGDPTISLDGAIAHGTGSEEYFNAGVYVLEGTFDSLFATIPFLERNLLSQTGAASMLRWHILSSPMNFQESLRFEWEYGPNNPATASDYTSVAIYYLE
jgi:hypothetical protein